MADRAWRITDWETTFEIAQSRRRPGRLNWVPMPTRHDSRGYRKLIRGEDGVRHFAAWCAIVQVAGRCHVRGVLADDRGVPLTVDDLEAMTDISAAIFRTAVGALSEIGWLTADPVPVEAVGADSEGSTSEVRLHDSTDTTSQTRQDTTRHRDHSREFLAQSAADEVWNKIPVNRRKSRTKWLQAWVEVIVDGKMDPVVVSDAICAYYASEEGASAYHRHPPRLLRDAIWTEDPSAWVRDGFKLTDDEAAAEASASLDRVFGEETRHDG